MEDNQKTNFLKICPYFQIFNITKNSNKKDETYTIEIPNDGIMRWEIK